jgi:hypothetical protein
MESRGQEQPLRLAPRVAEMVRHLIEHQEEIERQPTGRVTFDYAPREVAFSLMVKRGLSRIQRHDLLPGST